MIIKLNTKIVSLLVLSLILLGIFLISKDLLFNGGLFTFCLHEQLLGFQCPGCGMTRAIYAVLHLDFISAAQLNASVFGLIPFALNQFAYLFTKHKILKKINRLTMYTFFSMLSIVYVFRLLNYLF